MGSKPGWKTTEFWLTLAAVIVGVLLASGAFADGGTVAKILGVAATALASIGYTFARAQTKKLPAGTVVVKAAEKPVDTSVN